MSQHRYIATIIVVVVIAGVLGDFMSDIFDVERGWKGYCVHAAAGVIVGSAAGLVLRGRLRQSDEPAA